MRTWTPFTLAICATLAFALNNAIDIPAGQSTLQVSAGQSTTIKWSNPSSGTVTIKLQQGSNITPDSGVVLASDIPASSETATFQIPATVNTHQYTIEIIDDTDPTNINFSPEFSIQGATGTQTGLIATDTGSATASTASASSASSTSGSTESASSTSASSESASSSSASTSSASTSSSSATESSSSRASSSVSAVTASQTTSVPTAAAVPLEIPRSFLAAILGFAALL